MASSTSRPSDQPLGSDSDIGTGIWAMVFAGTGPLTRVIGNDLSSIQSKTLVPPNCQFQVADAEQNWIFTKHSVSIHDYSVSVRMTG